ncbi:hypothetical protein [Streptomyces sp. NPDC054834]
MTSLGADTNDKASVTIRCQDNTFVGVTFCDRFRSDADSVHRRAVRLRSPGTAPRSPPATGAGNTTAFHWLLGQDQTTTEGTVRITDPRGKNTFKTVDGCWRVSSGPRTPSVTPGPRRGARVFELLLQGRAGLFDGCRVDVGIDGVGLQADEAVATLDGPGRKGLHAPRADDEFEGGELVDGRG